MVYNLAQQVVEALRRNGVEALMRQYNEPGEKYVTWAAEIRTSAYSIFFVYHPHAGPTHRAHFSAVKLKAKTIGYGSDGADFSRMGNAIWAAVSLIIDYHRQLPSRRAAARAAYARRKEALRAEALAQVGFEETVTFSKPGVWGHWNIEGWGERHTRLRFRWPEGTEPPTRDTSTAGAIDLRYKITGIQTLTDRKYTLVAQVVKWRKALKGAAYRPL